MEDFENNDVREVFEAHAKQQRRENLSGMWMTLEQLSHMTHYDPDEWDPPKPGRNGGRITMLSIDEVSDSPEANPND